MTMLSSVFWFLSLPVFIYISYQLSKLAVDSFEKKYMAKPDEGQADEKAA